MTALLLFICSCAYLRRNPTTRALIDRQTKGPGGIVYKGGLRRGGTAQVASRIICAPLSSLPPTLPPSLSVRLSTPLCAPLYLTPLSNLVPHPTYSAAIIGQRLPWLLSIGCVSTAAYLLLSS